MTTKLVTELQAGDIIRVEYGDYNNWVRVIVDNVEVFTSGEHKGRARIKGRFVMSRRPVEMWSDASSREEILSY